MWLTLDWWKFLLERPKVGQSRWTCFWCRARGHPAGVWLGSIAKRISVWIWTD